MIEDLEKTAIERLKYAEGLCSKLYPGDSLTLCYSGGKDSDVILHLAIKSGVKFKVVYNMTGIDHPTVYREIKSKFEELKRRGIQCKIRKWEKSIFHLIQEKMFLPSRKKRFCCKELKEKTDDVFIITGVRWDESWKRQRRKDLEIFTEYIKNDGYSQKELILSNDNDDKRKMIENCNLKSQRVINPIIDWSDNDVYAYIIKEKIKISEMYKYYKRIGCIFCPMSTPKNRQLDAEIYPGFYRAFYNACERSIEKRKLLGKLNVKFDTAKKMMDWFMSC